MSVLEELKKKIADIETQSLAMDGCRPTFTVSDIMDLIDSVELAQNLHNACADGDYISKQAAIDAVEESRRLNHHQDGKEACAHEYEHRHFLKILRDLPSAQPERKRGKWIVYYECPKCGEITKDFTEYCPFCNADMRGEKDSV